MAGGLADVERKIERARRHIVEVQEVIELTLDDQATRFSTEFDESTKEHVIRVHDLPAIEPELSLIVGEALYNLRSALDHLAWQLVVLDGKQPTRRTQFPVWAAPRKQPKMEPPLDNPRILDALEQCQPYTGPERPLRRHPLWQLNELNNIDKHRLLLVVAATFDSRSMYWGGDAAYDRPPRRIRAYTGPLYENAEVAWFDFHGEKPRPDFDPHPDITISLSEPELPEAGRIPLADLLDSLHRHAQWGILREHFEPLFAAAGER